MQFSKQNLPNGYTIAIFKKKEQHLLFYTPQYTVLWHVMGGYDMLSFQRTRLTARKWTTASMVCFKSRHFSSKLTAPGRSDMASQMNLVLSPTSPVVPPAVCFTVQNFTASEQIKTSGNLVLRARKKFRSKPTLKIRSKPTLNLKSNQNLHLILH